MDVTRDVFFELLPELEEAIQKALFIGIDGEFTGLDNGSALSRNTPYDPPEQVYSRYFKKALDFLLIQFGMCIFYYDEHTQKYTHQAYNFYVFPQSNGQHEPENIFKCQSSSLVFLAHEGFDFNKLFRKGIPYLVQEEEDKKRKALEEKWRAMKKPQNKVPSDIPIPEEKEYYLRKICNQVRQFLQNDKDSVRLSLAPSSPFVRKLIYQEVDKEFGNEVCLRTDEDKKDLSTKQEKGILVFRATDIQTIKTFDQETEKREWRELEEAVGFSHVIKLLSQSGKLIVGHNMLLDVCHTVNRFVRSIPDNYRDFKALLHQTFPRMIDTKVMTSLRPFHQHFQSTTLQAVFETLSAPPFKVPECEVQIADRGYSTLKAKEHEAGYDAYLTGVCFLTLCDYLKADGKRVGIQADEIASEFLNKVYIWVLDAPYINFGSEDPKPRRQHVFHLEYPHEWKRTNINRLFKSVGHVNVSFLDETRAYVAVVDKNKIPMVKNVVGGVITRYDKYHSIQNKRVGNPEEMGSSKSLLNQPQGRNAKKQNEKPNPKRHPNEKPRNAKARNAGGSQKLVNRTELAGSSDEETEGHTDDDHDVGEWVDRRGKDECSTFEPPPAKMLKTEFDENDDWE